MSTSYLIAAILLLLANGFFVGAEFALVAARRSRIEHLAGTSDRADMTLKSMRELSLMLAGAQLGITMCSVGLGFVAEPAVAALLEDAIHAVAQLPEALLHTIAFVVALSIVTFLHMVVGEMAPKNIAITDPERTALWIAIPFRVFVNVFRPVVLVLNALANAGTRLLGVAPTEERREVATAAELGALIEESAREGLIEKPTHRLLSGAIEFGSRDAAAVMVPRPEMVAARIDATPAEIEAIVRDSGHTRIPLYAEDLDHVVGFFHAKDLLRVDPGERGRPLARTLVRQMLVVPESRRIRPLLADMQRERKHCALVIDEHGGTAGMVTIEDVIEELVGEIQDEYDVRELGVQHLAPDRYLVPGTLRIDEAAQHLGLELPEGDYDTVAGFLMDRLGRIPRRRDAVEHDGWRLRIRTMNRRRVVQVLIERSSAAPGARAAR
jgi:CBS domain containing-hemolysin-like protein